MSQGKHWKVVTFQCLPWLIHFQMFFTLDSFMVLCCPYKLCPLPHTQGLKHNNGNCRSASVEFKFIHKITSRCSNEAKHMSGENTATYHSIDKDTVDKAHVCLHLSSLLICQMTAKTVSLKTQQDMNNNI